MDNKNAVRDIVQLPAEAARQLVEYVMGRSVGLRHAVASIRYCLQVPGVRRAAIALAILSVLRRLNAALSTRALNNWTPARPWERSKEIAVVTGGSGGIGEHMVRKLAPKCVRVVVLDMRAPAVPFPDNVVFYEADLTSSDEVRRVASDIRRDVGHPTVLVNNAGVSYSHTMLGAPEADVRRTFDVNVISHYFLVQEFLPAMIKEDQGHVVTVASQASFISVAGLVDYCASKAAALALHEGLAQELRHRYGAKNVRTSVVHPIWVQTPMLDRVLRHAERTRPILSPEAVAQAVVDQVLSGTSGQLILPRRLAWFSALRGLPAWLQEPLRGIEAYTLKA